MTQVTNGTQTVEPILWQRYRSRRESNTRKHQLMSGRVAFTAARSAPREVTVVFVFSNELDAQTCELMHTDTGVLTVTEPGRDTVSMQYAVTGRVERELDTETAAVWIVSADVTEVSE